MYIYIHSSIYIYIYILELGSRFWHCETLIELWDIIYIYVCVEKSKVILVKNHPNHKQFPNMHMTFSSTLCPGLAGKSNGNAPMSAIWQRWLVPIDTVHVCRPLRTKFQKLQELRLMRLKFFGAINSQACHTASPSCNLLTERFATIQGLLSVELQVVPLLGHLVVVIWPWPLCCRFWHCACLNATSTAICRWGIHHHEHRLWQRLWHHGRPPSWGILEVHGAHIAHGIDGSPESLSRATYK